MSRKLLNDVDGYTVDEHAGTFTGTFEVSGADVRHMAYDDEVLLVVRARVKVPRLKETSKGELVRVNVLGVKEVGVVRSDTLKKHLCDTLGLELPAPQLALEFSEPVLAGPPAETHETEVETEVEYEVPDTAAFAGPKVLKFDPEADFGVDGPLEREVVGAVPTKKDGALANFLSGDPS